MKTLFSILTIALLCTGFKASAQDVIILNTGVELTVKVLKVGSTEIEYKKSDNLEGPAYTVAKKEVYMIKYENGSKDVLGTQRDLEKEKAESIRAAEEEAAESRRQWQLDYDRNMHRYKRKLNTGIVCTAIGVPFVITGASLLALSAPYVTFDYDDLPTGSNYTAMAVAGGVMLGAGIPLSIVGPIHIGTSFKFKKRANEAKANLTFVPSTEPANAIYGAQSGLAMRITF